MSDGSESELDRETVVRVLEELYLSGYINETELDDVDPGYEYAIQQLCSDLQARDPEILTKDEETEAANRAQDRFDDLVEQQKVPPLVTDGGTPEMKSIECPNCRMPYTVPEAADHWSCDCGASWELDPRTDGGHDLGVECDVDDCESRVVGLGDGWEVSRGTVCQDCLDYRDRHGHWPDEDPEICVECRLDEGAIRHRCDEAAADAVILNRGSACDFCGFEPKVMTDGGRDIDYDEPPEIPDPPMYPEWEDVETWSKANLRYPVPGGWEIADHGKFHTTWEHEDGTELSRTSKPTPGQKDTFAFTVDGEEIHSVDTGPQRVEMREETVWLLQFYDENDIDSVEEFEVAVRKERNQSLDEFATDGGVDQSEAGDPHTVTGTGKHTRVRCATDGREYGPGAVEETVPNWCPYCGDDVTDGAHRLGDDYEEVFCEKSAMSTWRYCPGCGEEVA